MSAQHEPGAAYEHYAEVKATLEGLHGLMVSLAAPEIARRLGPASSHARGYTHKITAALRHLEALVAIGSANGKCCCGATIGICNCRVHGVSNPSSDDRVKAASHEMLAALRASRHTLHQMPGNEGACLCGQCEFVRMRNAVIEKIDGSTS